MGKFFLILILLFSPWQFVNAAQSLKPQQWSFFIFLNGKNDLDEAAITNLIEMEKVGSNDVINIIVEWGSLRTNKTVRLRVEKSKDPTKITSPILEDLGSVDMGSDQSLKEFIAWGVKNFPAEHYFVAIWNHGGGWEHHLTKNNPNKGARMVVGNISYDDTTHHSITTEQLGPIMAYAAKVMGHKLDIYGSDACSMGMAEIADEMSDAVQIFIGSEAPEPNTSWPYAKFLSHWQATQDANAKTVATLLVDEYYQRYNDGDDVTLSAFDLSYMRDFDLAIQKVGAGIRSLNPSLRHQVYKILLASLEMDEYIDDYHDMGSFLTLLAQAKIPGLPAESIRNAMIQLRRLVVASEATGIFRKALGVSIWMPESFSSYDRYAKRYAGLFFSQQTQWNETLAFLLQGEFN